MIMLEDILNELELDVEIVGKYVRAALEDESLSQTERHDMLVEYLSSGKFQPEEILQQLAANITNSHRDGSLEYSKPSDTMAVATMKSKRKGLSFIDRNLLDISAAKQAQIHVQIQSQIADMPRSTSSHSSNGTLEHSGFIGASDIDMFGTFIDHQYSSSLVGEETTPENYDLAQNDNRCTDGNEGTPYRNAADASLIEKSIKEAEESTLTEYEIIRDIFKVLDPEVVWELFLATEFDTEAVLSSLLLIDAKTLVNPTQTQTPNKRVCKFLLKGECYRSDCWFSHDLTSYICKFWLQGSCIKDSRCAYLHEWPPQLMSSPDLKFNSKPPLERKSKPQPKPPVLNSEEFPSLLGSGYTKSSLKALERAKTSENFGDSKIEIRNLDTNKAPTSTTLNPSTKEFVPKQSRKKVLYMLDNLDTSVSELYAVSSPARTFLGLPSINPFNTPSDSSLKPYFDLYENAIMQARQRNEKMRAACDGYNAGDNALALKLTQECFKLNASVHNLYLKACNVLLNVGDPSVKFLHLYGFCPNDAVELLASKIVLLKPETENLFVITSGYNLPTKEVTQLTMEVILFIQKNNYEFRQFSDKRFFGLINVII